LRKRIGGLKDRSGVRCIEPWAKILRFPETLAKIQRGERVWPVNVEFDLSNRCNLTCRRCDFAYTHDGVMMEKPLVLCTLRQLADCGAKAVTFTGGGEPTMSPHFVLAARTARELGMDVGVYTNGTNQRPVSEALDCLTWLYVSLDEVDAGSYLEMKGANRFVDVLDNIQRWARHAATVGVGFLLHDGNWRDADDMVALGVGAGASYVQFRPTVGLPDYSWVPDALAALGAWDDGFVYISRQRFLDMMAGEWERGYTRCRASELVPCVGAGGEVWVCPNTRGTRFLGNLRDKPFADIWERRRPQFVGDDCRVSCRNHALNETLEYVCSEAEHGNFV
jgi:MoaA/NifB/PqqE/SkfB family radical SAM enzyme